ncbi:hypothetical protein HF086_010615 [Spodoptera exigua]|uniref:Uncharacterized protein n=1 Tax=Spodoptera exigua TaxID=7107 RepID=A0A922MUM4_SPOEX|nr:hypothetical protein HF086_010615 [Spodoptera exigua]
MKISSTNKTVKEENAGQVKKLVLTEEKCESYTEPRPKLSNDAEFESDEIIENTPPRIIKKSTTNKDKVARTPGHAITKNLVSYSDSSSEDSDDNTQQPKNRNKTDLSNKEPNFVASGSTPLLEVANRTSPQVDFNSTPKYAISPIYTDESDVDLSDDDPTYVHTTNYGNKQKNFFISSPSRSLSSSCDSDVSNKEVKRGRKRIRDSSKWKQNKAKRLRNSGQPYTSVSKKEKRVPGRCLQPPCTEKCKLKCSNIISTDTRYELFTFYWNLSDLYQQRAFIKSSMVDIKPRYQYTNAENPRKPNKAYYFTIDNRPIRVCKTFFKATLNISDRMIFTTQQKTNNNNFFRRRITRKAWKSQET